MGAGAHKHDACSQHNSTMLCVHSVSFHLLLNIWTKVETAKLLEPSKLPYPESEHSFA